MISSCVITGSLAEFRTYLRVGLQRSPSPPCNIDVPFGKWFHPKLLTEDPCNTFFSAQPLPAGAKPPHARRRSCHSLPRGKQKKKTKQAVSHSHLICPLAIPLNLLSGNVAHQNTTQPSCLGPQVIPERRIRQRSLKGSKRGSGEWGGGMATADKKKKKN